MGNGYMANRKTRIAKTATEALKILWEERFFRSWRNLGDIEATLAKTGHHFSDPELGMALKRARFLTRRGKRRSYEYIQKYPFTPATASSTQAAKG